MKNLFSTQFWLIISTTQTGSRCQQYQLNNKLFSLARVRQVRVLSIWVLKLIDSASCDCEAFSSMWRGSVVKMARSKSYQPSVEGLSRELRPKRARGPRDASKVSHTIERFSCRKIFNFKMSVVHMFHNLDNEFRSYSGSTWWKQNKVKSAINSQRRAISTQLEFLPIAADRIWAAWANVTPSRAPPTPSKSIMFYVGRQP